MQLINSSFVTVSYLIHIALEITYYALYIVQYE